MGSIQSCVIRRNIKKRTSNQYFNLGCRFINIILSSMRMECSELNSHKFKRSVSLSKSCICGHSNETIHHYFLKCPKYTTQRIRLINSLKPGLNEEIILHGYPKIPQDNIQLIKSLTIFINSTKRFNKLTIRTNNN